MLVPSGAIIILKTEEVMSVKNVDVWSTPALPSTVDEAITWCCDNLPEHVLTELSNMEQDELIQAHFGLGRHLRNELGLWTENKSLLESLGKPHPDDASGVLIRKLWEELRR